MSKMPANTKSKVRILVVDDHPGTAMTLARAIAQLGLDIETMSATSGVEALEKVEGGSVDVLVTDMMMPRMNGLELIERLQTHPGGRPTYIILITAYDVPGLKETARRLKVNETLIKPVRPERICQVIGKMLETMGRVPEPSSVGESHLFKILVADDSQDNLTLMSRYMQNEGYGFITASNGIETLEKVRSEMPDLVLLDVNMPLKDGFTVLEEMRADPAVEHIPVIIFTAARPNPEDVQEGLNLGADDYITKPFDRRELFARIRAKLRVKEADDLIRKRNRELSVLPEIGKELSTRLEINELSEIVLRRMVETLGAMVGHIFIFNSKSLFHKEYRISSPSNFEMRLPPLNDLFQQIKVNRETILVEDTHKDQRWQSASDGSAIIVPMFGRFDLIGLFMLIHERKGYFNVEHQVLLQAIASQAGIAVENARLYADMAQEQQKLAAVLQSAADAILMFDADSCLSLANPAAQKLFTDYEAKLGLPLARSQGYDALIELVDAILISGKPKTAEISWTDQRVFSALFTPIQTGGCVVLLHDITHFKSLDRVKNEFIATASHDLKNPIGVISGFSDLLVKTGPLNDMQLGFVEHIHSAAENMNELVQNLLELIKIDMGVSVKRTAVNMQEVLVDMANEFQPLAETKEQTLIYKKAKGQFTVEADPLQLRQALRNLIGNAIKYTPQKGSIKISMETDEDTVSINVKDTGYGIPPEELPFIFDRFYRVRSDDVKDIKGNGLGLAIVKSIVEQHGGQISVESIIGKGACFSVSLPLMITINSSEIQVKV